MLGYGVIAVENSRPVFKDMGVLDLRKEKSPYTKLARIYEKVISLIEHYSICHVACESPFYGKNAQVILKLGRAQGAAITAAAHKGLQVSEYAPREAKMAIVGNGAASKEQVKLMVLKTLGLEADPKFLDATDALGIALCHFYSLTGPFSASRVSGSSSSRKKGGGCWEDFIKEHPERVK